MSVPSKELNLKFIKRSRLKQGDIFALLIGGAYLFGRVVNDQIPMMGDHVSLMYVYNVRAKEPKVDTAELTPDKLLLPPFIPFSSFWTKGYAAKIGSGPIHDRNLLSRHCFKVNENKYVDEFGNPIEKLDSDYCGTWGIVGTGTIDDWISDAVGIKRMPLQEDDIWYISGKGEKIWLKKPLSELKKYSNYEEIIKQYPDIIE